MMRQRIRFIPVFFLVAIGIVWYLKPPKVIPNAIADEELKSTISKQGEITFRSWNGKWIGTDCDTDITFKAGGVVEVTEYGDGVQRYQGKYQIDSNGLVSLQLEKIRTGWPAMVIEKDGKSFLLRPNDSNQGSLMGCRGGDSSYWPFRPMATE